MTANQNHKQAFKNDGYLLIRQFLSKEEVDSVKNIHNIENAKSGLSQAVGDKDTWENKSDTGGRNVLRKIGKPFDRYPEFKQIFSSDKVLNIIEVLMGPEIYLHSSKLMCKPATVGRRKPWHQDWAYWEDMNPEQITLWVAIEPSTKQNGCLEVIPGSHKLGLIPHEDIDDWQVNENNLKEEDKKFLVMESGDAVFLNVLTLHASGPNLSNKSRLAAIINYNGYPLPENQKSRYGTTIPLRSSIMKK